MSKCTALAKITALASLLSLGLVACGQTNSGVAAAGGSVSTGGKNAANAGGSSQAASHTATNSGGAAATGGAPNGSGGAVATVSGGAVATGGGGAVAAGGANGSGGVLNSGGAASSGGTMGSGGTQNVAATATGGTSIVANGSGSTATAPATGGSKSPNTSATGGQIGSGGTLGSGGLVGAGGAGGAQTVTCPTPSLKAGDSSKTVAVGSTSRTYTLHVPTKYDGSKPGPLVLDFHGLGSTGSGELGSSPYKSVLDAEGVISAYPDGEAGPSGTAWNIGPCCVPGVDDVAFAKALVADVEKVACVDPKRVYAVGFSIGGGMTHYIGCHAADVFAAIAPAAADLLKENEADCTPSRPMPVIFFRGTADTSVPYAGGVMTSSGMTLTSLGAKATFQKWADIDQCTGSPSAEDSNGCSTYASCAQGVQVTLCTKQGGGHEAGNASVGWPVLKKYTLP